MRAARSGRPGSTLACRGWRCLHSAIMTTRSSPPGGGRMTTVRVKTARKRSHSSTLWLERQLNDPYVAEAKRLGMRSRAAFKLSQLDDKYRLLKPGMRIVDLGAAPGGWTQIAVQRAKAESPASGTRIIALDILPM